MIMNIKVVITRKYLNLVFGIRKLVNNFHGMRKLDYNKKSLYIFTENIREFETRANSCLKEPETIKWIEDNSKKCKVFYDIGANIGAYSLVAAINGMKVLAFEPSFAIVMQKLQKNYLKILKLIILKY